MPVMDGYEATQKIREVYFAYGISQPIILAVTGHCEKEYVKRAMNSGMNQVLSKPIKGEILRKLINHLNIPIKKNGINRRNTII